jgi:hypothetical protein
MIQEGSGPYPEVVRILPGKDREGIAIRVTGDNPDRDFELRPRQAGWVGRRLFCILFVGRKGHASPKPGRPHIGRVGFG